MYKIDINMSFKILYILLTFFLGINLSAGMDIFAVVLVDFGSNAQDNVYELEGWQTVIKSPYVNYTPAGPGGLVLTSNFGEYIDYQGIQGIIRNFHIGERIVVTWYNNSSYQIRFIPRISFSDPDYPESGVKGTWFTMRNYDDYRKAMITAAPYSTVKSVFNIVNSGVNAASGDHNLVNINLHIEWGQSEYKQYLICDKIELLYDADIIPPEAPDNLAAVNISDTSVLLEWSIPYDNIGIYEYFIYNGQEIEGHSLVNSFQVSMLEPSAEYSFSVLAVDEAGNYGPESDNIIVATSVFQGGSNLIKPSDFEYLGAFKLPYNDIYSYGGDGFAYYSEGDGGHSGSGAIDGFPGSLFITNLNQQEHGFVCEISIPEPVISQNRDVSELNTAVILQDLTNIRPSEIDNWEYVDIWKIGLDIVSPRSALSSYRLYSTWGFHYQLDMQGKTASLSWCSPDNLQSYIHPYAHYIGGSYTAPYDPQLNNYLFSIDHDYAVMYFDSKSLITGRYRDGGLSGLGPAMYALAPWEYGENPANNSEFDYITLLEYGSVNNATQYYFPDSILYYNHSDEWSGAVWLSVNDQRAAALIGINAVGDNWYGYTGESMPLSWIEWNIPMPGFWDTDPDGKGWRSNNSFPMIILYDPADLFSVFTDEMAPHEPQPYAAVRLDKEIFFGENYLIRSAACDHYNNFLYVVEGDAYEWGRMIIHVWKVNEASYAELLSFSAYGTGNQADISWVTMNETENMGFNIYRLNAKKVNPFISYSPVKLNEELIPGVNGYINNYGYQDYIKNGGNYFYILEMIYPSGYSTEYRTRLLWLKH